MKTEKKPAVEFFSGQRVAHPVYGTGTVIRVEKKGGLRHKRSQNIGVKFDKGGPQGWADRSSNLITELEVIN